MAVPEVRLKNSSSRVKLRNARNVGLLDLVTLGIYGVYWYYVANRELALLGSARGKPELGTNPARSFFALVPGYVLIVPAAISTLHTGRRIQAAQRMAGCSETDLINPVLTMVSIMLLPPLGLWYAQKRLSLVWAREAEEPVTAVEPAPSARPATR